jgi:hypothetical protein
MGQLGFFDADKRLEALSAKGVQPPVRAICECPVYNYCFFLDGDCGRIAKAQSQYPSGYFVLG